MKMKKGTVNVILRGPFIKKSGMSDSEQYTLNLKVSMRKISLFSLIVSEASQFSGKPQLKIKNFQIKR